MSRGCLKSSDINNSRKILKKALIMGFPTWGVLGTLRLGILLADGIDKQALATLNNLLLNHSSARLTEMNHG